MTTRVLAMNAREVFRTRGLSRRLRLPEEAVIEAQQEQHQMHKRAREAYLRREDDARSHERHRHLREIEIDLDAPALEERAREELADRPKAPGEVKPYQRPDDDDGCQHHIKTHWICSSQSAAR